MTIEYIATTDTLSCSWEPPSGDCLLMAFVLIEDRRTRLTRMGHATRPIFGLLYDVPQIPTVTFQQDTQ